MQLIAIAVLLSGLSFVRGCDVRFTIQERSTDFNIVYGTPELHFNSTWYFISYSYYYIIYSPSRVCRALGCQSYVSRNQSSSQVTTAGCGRLDGTSCSCNLYESDYGLKISCHSDTPRIASVSIQKRELRFNLNSFSLDCLSAFHFYKLACTQGGQRIREEMITTTTRTIRIRNLYPYTEYVCSIEVYNEYNALVHKYSSNNRRTMAVAPSPPRTVRVTSSSTTASLTWVIPEFPNGTILSYSVNCHNNIFSLRNPITSLTTPFSSVNIYNLNPFTNYTCCVSASNSIGEGEQSCKGFQTSESSPVQAPQFLNVVSSAYHAFLMWEPPEVQHRNGLIREYRIEVNSTDVLENYISTEVSFNLTSLHPYYHYTVSISAFTVAEGPHAVLTFQTEEAAPSAPPNISIVQTLNTSFELRLSPPPLEYWNGILLGYRIVVNSTGSNFEQTTPIQTMRLTVDDLSPLTTYSCKVAANTSAGTGIFTDPVNVTTLSYIGPTVEKNNSSDVIISAIGIATVLIVILIIITVLVIVMIVMKSKQQRRYQIEELDMKITDETNDAKNVKPKKKPKRKEKRKKKWGKREKVSNKYEVPTHCVLQDTSFITHDNFDLFVEKKVSDDDISGSSSMILELPQRQYLDDQEFTKELHPKPLDISALLESNGASDDQKKHIPQHIVVAGSSHFINEKNFSLFVETKTSSDGIFTDGDYEGTAPQLPQRGYLDDGDLDEVPQLPERRYTDEDVKGIRKNNNSYELNPVNMSTTGKKSEKHESGQKISQGAEGVGTTQGSKKPQRLSDKEESPSNDYMSLNPSTLDRGRAAMIGSADVYMSLTQSQEGRQSSPAQQSNPDYMSVDSKTIKESSYMSLTRTAGNSNGDDDDYMSLNPGTMNRDTAALAYSVGLKNAMAAMETSSRFAGGHDTK